MIEIRFPIDEAFAQQLEDYFCEEYQEYWSIEENRLTHENFLRGFFEDQQVLAEETASLRKEFPSLPDDPPIKELPDQDWKEAYKLHFKPWSERGLHWVPLWEKDTYQLPEGEEIVYLDPGMAFGTGNHETTRLCVRRLLDARDEWGSAVSAKRVIDAGCGSGILAISAAKVGFTDVTGFDNDPDSVRISLENEKLCDLDGRIDFKWADLKEGLIGQTGDLLLANILANVLCDHAELLCQSVRPGGWLVLSGILASEVKAVHAVFAPVVENHTGTLPDMDARIEGEWSDLCYRF
ncbi:methyltransferase domain-containing protein [Puniceicoccales bacterium CK1056]|uniref:Methyltransferase domain-containing protein n=1 Tax=Oceanipulchritudo coccoides TaxID=2706888 RepID=A0A6B2M310_9BACT|nr:50S ribosomal protein L11 methyltransferase [Oceanipulchritudo coccoides]NDV62195.1 methyltransferase domain-containing protein [Oceanipulchritudo coccoides]